MSSDPILARTVRIKLGPDQTPISADNGFDSSDGAADSASRFEEPRREHLPRERTPEYRRLLHCIYDAVLITDRQGWVVEFNHRASALFCRDANDIEGRNISEFVSGLDDSALTLICQDLTPERYALVDATCVRKNETTFPSEVAINRIDLFPDGHLCFFVRDVTERRRAQKALEDAIARLEAHDKARSQFVSNVSHELRTPLTSMIYAIANMLKGVVGPLSDHATQYIEMLQGDSKRLLTTVNDILDLRKIESGTLTLARQHIRLLPFVKRSVDSLRVQAQQKSVSVTVEEGAHSIFVNCDTQKMERVILNVVGNAIKFTDPGGQIAVSIGEDRLDDGWVRILITDDGLGIPAEALPHVTERYFTVGAQPDGSGVGLAICSEIVQLHGGEMEIISPPPFAERGTQVSVAMETVTPPTVLLAGDEDVFEKIQILLKKCGYALQSAATHKNIISMIDGIAPSLVVLNMTREGSEMDRTAVELKSAAETARIPIIALTSGLVGHREADKLSNLGIPMVSGSSDTDAAVAKMEEIMAQV